MVSVHRLDDGGAAAWDSFVAACPEATFFHRAGWRPAIQGAFGQKACFLYAERQGAIRAVLPLVHMRSTLFGDRLVSTPFSVGGGVAASDDEARAALEAEALALMGRLGARYLEFRQPPRPHPDSGAWAARRDLHATYEMPISGVEDADRKLLSADMRRLIRKAAEAGLVDEVDDHPDRFFPIYAETMRDLGTPVFGLGFFRRLMAEFGADCQCLIVSHQGRPLSASMNFFFRDRVILHFLGNLPEARKLSATHFLLWRLMRRAGDRGARVFDYGRSKVGSGNAAFKKGIGFTARPIANEFAMAEVGATIPELNPTNPRYAQAIKLWKRLPLPLANLLGPQVIRHIG